MKRHINILITSIMLVGALTASAQAQSASTQKVIANIPFAFNVGNTNLPAGKYTITVLNPTSDRKTLQIRSTDGRASAITLTSGVVRKASEETKLVFRRYGDQYFFAQAQMGGDTLALAALKSNAERSQEQALAKAGKKTIVVITAE